MLKKLMVTTAVSALMATAALAQSTTSPSSDSTPSATPSTSSSSSSSSGAAGANVITRQESNQWLASKLKGTDVIGSDNQKIGDVSDILFDQSGKVDAYVISVGGFLGVGSKEVALAPSSFQVVNDNNTQKLKTSMTKDQLKQAANFEPASSRTTTGSAGSMSNSATSNRPATSPRPSNQ